MKLVETAHHPHLADLRRWMPDRVVFTRAAWDEPFGRSIRDRVEGLGLPVEVRPGNRLPRLGGGDEREAYRRAKRTLAVTVAPPSTLAA